MLLWSDANKEFPDLSALGVEYVKSSNFFRTALKLNTLSSLPFLLHNDCALGIAVKSYLDELIVHPDATSPEAKHAVLETASTRYFPQCVNLRADLEVAFLLWDAVSSIRSPIWPSL